MEENKLDETIDANNAEKNIKLQKLKTKTRIFQVLTIIEIIFTIYLIFNFLFTGHTQSSLPINNMSNQEIAAYNIEFSKYYGTQKGIIVKNLIETVRTHNLANDDNLKKIKLIVPNDSQKECTGASGKDKETGSNTSEIENIKNSINVNKTYTVKFDYSNSGLIKVISIK